MNPPCEKQTGNSEDMTREEFIALSNACDFLEHYHTAHTQDAITRFRSDGPDRADILVVSDPKWKAKLREFCAPAFPKPETHFSSGQTYRRKK